MTALDLDCRQGDIIGQEIGVISGQLRAAALEGLFTPVFRPVEAPSDLYKMPLLSMARQRNSSSGGAWSLPNSMTSSKQRPA